MGGDCKHGVRDLVRQAESGKRRRSGLRVASGHVETPRELGIRKARRDRHGTNGRRERAGERRRPVSLSQGRPMANAIRTIRATEGYFEARACSKGATGMPTPIFWRLPTMMRSVSDTPSAATSSPWLWPSVTSFCSTLLSAPTM